MSLSKKNEYFKNKFKKYKHDIKKTWQTINEILGRTKANISKTNCILEAGKMIYEPKKIANTFNTHFSTISCKLISHSLLLMMMMMMIFYSRLVTIFKYMQCTLSKT